MLLNRFNVTEQSREMIPAFPMFSAGVGIAWIVTPATILTNTPTFEMMMRIAPNWVWGSLWLAVGYLMIHAVINESRKLYVQGLTAFIVLAVLFSGTNLIAFFVSGATISAWAWPAFVGFTAWVQLRSLKRHDTNKLFNPVDVG